MMPPCQLRFDDDPKTRDDGDFSTGVALQYFFPAPFSLILASLASPGRDEIVSRVFSQAFGYI